MIRRSVVLSLVAAMVLGTLACREEGPAEKAGRKLDEAVDELTGKGAAERLGEDIDEAVGSAKQALDDTVEKARKAAEDARR